MTFARRFAGALKLNAATYEEIEASPDANIQALAVVVLWTLAAGVGGAASSGGSGLLVEMVGALIGWVAWAGVTYLIGTKLLPEPQTQSNMGELLRVIGFSSAPGVFAVLAAVPYAGVVLMTGIAFWMLASMVVGVRQALDYRSTARAIVVVLIGWLLFVLAVILIMRD